MELFEGLADCLDALWLSSCLIEWLDGLALCYLGTYLYLCPCEVEEFLPSCVLVLECALLGFSSYLYACLGDTLGLFFFDSLLLALPGYYFDCVRRSWYCCLFFVTLALRCSCLI